MPYNSSSFERQLARYRNEQAAQKALSATGEDQHLVKPKAGSVRVEIRPGPAVAAQPSQVLGEQQQRRMEKPEMQTAPHGEKPFYRRGWFLFLAFSVLSTAAIPVFFKSEMQMLSGVTDSVRAETGLDLTSAQTYKNMIGQYIHRVPAQPESPDAPQTGSGHAEPSPGEYTAAQPADFHAVVENAQARALEVSKQGSASSLKYIDEEAKRLQQMSRDFDAKYGQPPQ